ncbi:hypothetical protein Bca4012_035768 [Brassica carinata]|uniref:Uncharacterized protein n=1 Tax=Brassica carinata TaxID=52824 RepID=A0A8X7WEA2_BRACI|nr:hypothetical protein Bca52824_009591 [Brassica carinata]
MADGYGYGGFSGVPYPIFLSSPSPHPPTSAPPIQPFESYDPPTQGGFDPMISHGSYHRSPADWSNYPPYGDNSRSQTPSSSFGNFGPRGEDSHKDMFSPSGFNPSRGSSSDVVPLPTENFLERQRYEWVPYTSASLEDMLIRNSQEPFYQPIPPFGGYASSNAFDDKRPGDYHHGYGKPGSMNALPGLSVEPCVPVPSLPVSSFGGSQTGIRLGDGRPFPSHAPENVQSSLHGSSIEPVNFDVLLGYGEATGNVKPLSEKTVGSPGSRSPRSSHPLQFSVMSSGSLFKEKREGSGVSSLYQMPNTLVADIENGISESSLKNSIEDLNGNEHRSWNHFMVSSEGPSAPTVFSMGSEPCGAMKSDNGNTAHSAVNYRTPSEGSANQPSEDVQASEKTCKLQEQLLDPMSRAKKTSLLTDVCIKGSSRSDADDVSTGRSPEKHLCDQGDIPSPPSSPRVSSVINAMHNLSEVLVYECFNNGSWLMPEQLENLDKVVENLTKCLKKITSNKKIAGEASVPTQAMNVSCSNVVDLNEAPKNCQGFNVKPLDSFGFKEPVEKDTTEMTQSIKNILASNFPDGEENHPKTLLYKNLWLETEAALCSSTCMARYHRIKNEIDNLKLQNIEVSADAPTFTQEPFLNPQKSVSIMKTVEQVTTESLIKQGSNCGNNVVTTSHDAPQSFIFSSDPMDAVLSLMSRSFTGGLEQENHGNVKPDAQKADTIQQDCHASTREGKYDDVIDRFQILKHLETKRKLKSQNCQDSDIGVMDRLQILKPQETNCKLNSQNFMKTRIEENQDQASEMAKIGGSSHVTDVMGRFQILKRREAEQVQKSLNSLDIDSDSEDDQLINKKQICDHLWPDSMMTLGENSQIEMHVETEPSAYSDWEHVGKDD